MPEPLKAPLSGLEVPRPQTFRKKGKRRFWNSRDENPKHHLLPGIQQIILRNFGRASPSILT